MATAFIQQAEWLLVFGERNDIFVRAGQPPITAFDNPQQPINARLLVQRNTLHGNGRAIKCAQGSVFKANLIKTVLSRVARGFGMSVLPASTRVEWTIDLSQFMKIVNGLVTRNRLCIALPIGEPITRLSRFLVRLTLHLCVKYNGVPGTSSYALKRGQAVGKKLSELVFR